MWCRNCEQEKPDEGRRCHQCRDCINAKVRDYQHKNRKKCTEQHKKWAKENPENHKEVCYRWRKKNAEKYNEYHREYQRKKREAQKKD